GGGQRASGSRRAEMNFLDDVRRRAAAARRRIAFPETADERTRTAVAALAADGIVDPLLILDPAAPETHDATRALGLEVRDPSSDPFAEIAADRLVARRGKRITKEEAVGLLHTPLFYANALVADGQADGCVAGAVHTTGDVLKAALWMVGP